MQYRYDGWKQSDDETRWRQKAREAVTNAVYNQITKQRTVLWPGRGVCAARRAQYGA